MNPQGGSQCWLHTRKIRGAFNTTVSFPEPPSREVWGAVQEEPPPPEAVRHTYPGLKLLQ